MTYQCVAILVLVVLLSVVGSSTLEHIKVGIRWGKDSLYGRGIVYCEYARICLEELGELGSVVGRESIEEGLGVRRDAEEDNSQTVEGCMIVDVLKTAGRRQTQKLNSTNVILDDLIDGCNDFQQVARKARDNDERALQQENLGPSTYVYMRNECEYGVLRSVFSCR